MDTQSGLLNMWTQGDIVTRAVAVLLLLMSLSSWMVIIVKALDLRRVMGQSRNTEAFWRASDFNDGLNKLGDETGNPFRQLALEGREAVAHVQDQGGRPQLHDSLDVSDWTTRCLSTSIDESTGKLQSGLAVLA